jgi:hypothetical protein
MAGVVDAVMSNDVDSLMFGSRVTIMNFSKEPSTGTKAATHVNFYKAEKGEDGREANVPLDRGGMILFALMSGGDYLPAGVPKCGPKLAAQIANAGFGADLLEIVCKMGADTDTELNKWRKRLQHELRENESGYFRKRHRAVQIPDSFPDRKILSDYTHPIVSSADQLELVRQSLAWDQIIDVAALWTFVSETLKWKHASGAKKFIKAFTTPLVSHRLRLQLPLVTDCLNSSSMDIENSINPQIYKWRALYATDGLSELQLEIVPSDVVGLDFDCETTSPLRQKEEESVYESSDLETTSTERTPYDPTRPNRIWVFEAIAKLGIPDSIETWEVEKQANLAASQNPKPKRAGSRTKKKKSLDPGMREGEILRYGIITKGSVTESGAKVTSTQKPAFSEQQSEPGSASLSHISGVRHLKTSLREQVNSRTSCQANENICNLPAPLVQREQIPHSTSGDLRPDIMVPYVTSSDIEAAMNVDYSDEGRSPFLSSHFLSAQQMDPDNPNSCHRNIGHAEKSTNCVLIPSPSLSLVFGRPAAGIGSQLAKLAPRDLVRRRRKAPLSSRFKNILEQPTKRESQTEGLPARSRDGAIPYRNHRKMMAQVAMAINSRPHHHAFKMIGTRLSDFQTGQSLL